MLGSQSDPETCECGIGLCRFHAVCAFLRNLIAEDRFPDFGAQDKICKKKELCVVDFIAKH